MIPLNQMTLLNQTNPYYQKYLRCHQHLMFQKNL
jgi:hypothetical protein